MPATSSISMTTRTSDLDSYRHVNNRIYGSSVWRAATGCCKSRVIPSNASQPGRHPAPGGFLCQVLSPAEIRRNPACRGRGFPVGRWHHSLGSSHQPTGGQAVCRLQAKTETLDCHRKPIELLPATEGSPVQLLIEDVPSFSGKWRLAASSYAIIYSDMDAFGKLPIAALWRIFEEGRHMFGEQLGLSTERLVHVDTLLFWVAGTYRYYQPLNPGQQVSVHTWLERIARIRVFIRQEIRTADGAELLGASREEHLVVSLSEARAKPLPSELATMLQAYVEYQG